jgi:hypothetical protein
VLADLVERPVRQDVPSAGPSWLSAGSRVQDDALFTESVRLADDRFHDVTGVRRDDSYGDEGGAGVAGFGTVLPWLKAAAAMSSGALAMGIEKFLSSQRAVGSR